MSRDALLAAILSGVLRPGTWSEQSLGFGRAPVTLLDIRQGFGSNVARLVAGVEHVTCVEETAHRILRGSSGIGGEVLEEADEVISPSLLIGVGSRGAKGAAGAAGGGGGGGKGTSLRDASALEQVCLVLGCIPVSFRYRALQHSAALPFSRSGAVWYCYVNRGRVNRPCTLWLCRSQAS